MHHKKYFHYFPLTPQNKYYSKNLPYRYCCSNCMNSFLSKASKFFDCDILLGGNIKILKLCNTHIQSMINSKPRNINIYDYACRDICLYIFINVCSRRESNPSPKGCVASLTVRPIERSIENVQKNVLK